MKALAVDIGASSGKMLVGEIIENRLSIEVIHRFKNEFVQKNGEDCWDIDNLFSEIKKGLSSCKDKNIFSLGVDTWGVDFILLDENNEKIGEAISYRDERTKGKVQEFDKIIDKNTLYKKTGIQFLELNTLYQILSIKEKNIIYLKKAKSILFIADYLHYLLCGIKKNEYTISSTSQMLNAKTCDWDSDIIEKLDIKHLFKEKPIATGSIIGQLKDSIKNELNIKNTIEIIAPASHDTASAVLSVPHIDDIDNDENWAYISSGTWSLMGIESEHPIISEKTLLYNITNEGGYGNKIRVLKNIMGMWIIQNIKKEYEDKYSFDDFEMMAKENVSFNSLIDTNDTSFYNPKSMRESIDNYLKKTNQQIPKDVADYVKCAYHSLANLYSKTIAELEEISDRKINMIYIVGGGSQDQYLNQLTADYTNVVVLSGPIEATGIGNLLVQFISQNIIKDIKEARKIVFDSFDIKKYIPKNQINNTN